MPLPGDGLMPPTVNDDHGKFAVEGPRDGKDCFRTIWKFSQAGVYRSNGGDRVPLTVHVSATGNAWSVQREVPYTVSLLQTVVWSSSTGNHHPIGAG